MPKTTDPRPEAIECAKCGVTVLVKSKGPVPTMCFPHRNRTPPKTNRQIDLAQYLDKQIKELERERYKAVYDLDTERRAHLAVQAELAAAHERITVLMIQVETLKEIAIGITGNDSLKSLVTVRY